MAENQQPTDNSPNEGEGNKTAAREYNEAQRRFAESGLFIVRVWHGVVLEKAFGSECLAFALEVVPHPRYPQTSRVPERPVARLA